MSSANPQTVMEYVLESIAWYGWVPLPLMLTVCAIDGELTGLVAGFVMLLVIVQGYAINIMLGVKSGRLTYVRLDQNISITIDGVTHSVVDGDTVSFNPDSVFNNIKIGQSLS